MHGTITTLDRLFEITPSTKITIKDNTMAWKNLNQRSLADSMMIDHEAIKELDGIHEFIDWGRIEGLLQGIHASTRGEKAWPPLLMVKALLLGLLIPKYIFKK